MRTDDETWLHEHLQRDAPPPMKPLDGQVLLHQGRTRRRHQRIATAGPLAAIGGLVLAASLWAAQLLPGPLQEALPAAPTSITQCPDIAPGEGTTADGSAVTQVTSDVEHQAILDWVRQDGTRVMVIRTTEGCLVPDEGEGQSSGVGLSVLTQAPDGPLMLHGSRDAGEDVARWGASVLEVPGQDVVVSIVPPGSQRVALPGGETSRELTPVTDAQGQVIAQVARLPYERDPVAVLWETDDAWSLSWTSADVVTQPQPQEGTHKPAPSTETDSPDSDTWPQLARSQDDGRWWAWVGRDTVIGPIESPDGAWALHLTDDELGDAFLGWVPEETTQLLIDGDPWEPLAMEQTIGEPFANLMPFARDVYQPAEELVSIEQDGKRTTIPIIEAPAID
ncbi:hypothetical protein [uncultured Serinicoccus sp.]|uniref:hypothetical protein n=1 Tax=uncultured Serinicoccus sp. TaxID=735514 RepID=UPI00261E860B|nr:hypothetical protein [uncultured Serinicoccus sp.]